MRDREEISAEIMHYESQRIYFQKVIEKYQQALQRPESDEDIIFHKEQLEYHFDILEGYKQALQECKDELAQLPSKSRAKDESD